MHLTSVGCHHFLKGLLYNPVCGILSSYFVRVGIRYQNYAECCQYIEWKNKHFSKYLPTRVKVKIEPWEILLMLKSMVVLAYTM